MIETRGECFSFVLAEKLRIIRGNVMCICGNNAFLQLSDLILDFHAIILIQPVPVFPYFGAIVQGPLRFLGQWLGGFASVG
jgi:hypothetical protein